MERLQLHLRVSEPWDFERLNGGNDLTGSTEDHLDHDNVDWDIELDQPFVLNDEQFDTVLVTPRYHGERLDRIHDQLATVAVDIARLSGEDWLFGMTGTLSAAPQGDA